MPFAKSLSELNDKQLAMIPKADRKEIGKAARTHDDALAAQQARDEKELQQQILALLEGHKNIVVIWSGMHRKTSTPKGTPDFIFAVIMDSFLMENPRPEPCAWEIKTPEGERSAEQEEMERRMTTPPNAWRYRVIRSTAQALEELREMGQ